MYERILVATDGSAHAERAASQAVELAGTIGAEVYAIYVIETRTAYDNAIVDPETVRENFRAEGTEALESVERLAERAGVDVTTEIREGIPGAEIIDAVEEYRVDLVVMGAKGSSEFKTVILGSATEAVLHADVAPVLIVDGESSSE